MLVLSAVDVEFLQRELSPWAPLVFETAELANYSRVSVDWSLGLCELPLESDSQRLFVISWSPFAHHRSHTTT